MPPKDAETDVTNSDRVLHSLNDGNCDYSSEPDIEVRARLVLKLCAFQYRTGLKAFHASVSPWVVPGEAGHVDQHRLVNPRRLRTADEQGI